MDSPTLFRIVIWALGFAALMGGLSAIVTITFLVRVRANFASKSDLAAAEENIRSAEARIMQTVADKIAELGNQQRAVFSRLGTLETSLSRHAAEMERAVGRLEGAVEALEKRG